MLDNLRAMCVLYTDMLLSTEEKSKNPPMFLCFRVGKPMRKSFAIGRTSSPVHSFGSRGKQPEYWFAVPQERYVCGWVGCFGCVCVRDRVVKKNRSSDTNCSDLVV